MICTSSVLKVLSGDSKSQNNLNILNIIIRNIFQGFYHKNIHIIIKTLVHHDECACTQTHTDMRTHTHTHTHPRVRFSPLRILR